MINIIIEDASVGYKQANNVGQKWFVKHPLNDSVIAYCENQDEAVMVREVINDLARQLRSAGFKVSQ